MKRLFTSFVLLSILFVGIQAQTNETENKYYKWKKGTSEFQKGYVVLKSGHTL